MSLKDQSTLRVVLYEGDGAQPLNANERFTALTALLERGYVGQRGQDEQNRRARKAAVQTPGSGITKRTLTNSSGAIN